MNKLCKAIFCRINFIHNLDFLCADASTVIVLSASCYSQIIFYLILDYKYKELMLYI